VTRVQEGKPYCLRVRLDMANANACLRDPVSFRCNDHPHWRTGAKHKCYPTYDFACPFVDAFEGVTHALRTSEYRDREEQYQRILKLMQSVDKSLPAVHIWDYSRLNFVHTGEFHLSNAVHKCMLCVCARMVVRPLRESPLALGLEGEFRSLSVSESLQFVLACDAHTRKSLFKLE
jgi:hypothetical protein